jgi:hypothetical protein
LFQSVSWFCPSLLISKEWEVWSWRLRTSRQNLFFKRARQGLKQAEDNFSPSPFSLKLLRTFAGTQEEETCADLKEVEKNEHAAIA